MTNTELQLTHGGPRSPLKPEKPTETEAGILWQIYESSFTDLPNLFEAVPKLVQLINSALTDPSISEKEKWLFGEKDGNPPSVSFMIFKDEEGSTVCLSYDPAFTTRALSTGGVTTIRLGQMPQDIYHQYYAAKLGVKDNLFKPTKFLLGHLAPSNHGFTLVSIFLDGWDCRKQFDAAMTIRGFPTEAYETISCLSHHSRRYRNHLVNGLIERYGLPPSVERRQLLDYYPPNE